MPDAAALLDELASRAEITEVVLRYARGIDRCDETMLRSCFHADSQHKHGTFEGSSAEFCTRALEIVRAVEFTHHQLGPVSIEFAGEVAFVETYYTALHRLGAEPPPGGKPHEDRFSGGRYIDRFERRGGAWRIARRHGVSEWMRYEEASDRGFYDSPVEQRGRRDRRDPVYRRD